MVEPEFSAYCPEAAVREGVEELTLRRDEKGGLPTFVDTTNVSDKRRGLPTFVDTTNVGDNRWGTPLVDEDGHAACQAIREGIEGEEWEKLYYKYVEERQGG